MWKLVNGELIHTTDESRENYSIKISKSILEKLKLQASECDSCVSYLIETGMEELLSDPSMTIVKSKTRPLDRVSFNSNYDRELLENIKEYAKSNRLFISQVFEYCAQIAKPEKAKKFSNKFRVERE